MSGKLTEDIHFSQKSENINRKYITKQVKFTIYFKQEIDNIVNKSTNKF